MASSMQYIASELLELAGESATQGKKKTISPKHLQRAIRGDPELNKMTNDIQISQGGTLSNISAALFPGKKGAVDTAITMTQQL